MTDRPTPTQRDGKFNLKDIFFTLLQMQAKSKKGIMIKILIYLFLVAHTHIQGMKVI